MNLEFQKEVLRYLAQDKTSKKYIKILEQDFFIGEDYGVVFQLLKDFVETYKGLPNEANLLQHCDVKATKKEGVDPEALKIVKKAIHETYKVSTANTDQIKESIISQYQKKLIRGVIVDFAGRVKDPDDMDIVQSMHKQIQEIKKLGENDLGEEENNRGTFLLAEHKDLDFEAVKAHPTYLKGLNRMTGSGGFYSPQLVIFMSEPKGFKTGLLLNIAKGYVRSGLKVYFADCENGHRQISDRVRQSMLHCTSEELRSGELNQKLSLMVKRYAAMGGDFRADFFPAKTKSIADVDAELDYLQETYNWVPDIVCYDYLDLFEPTDYRIKEHRFKIQAVYFDAIRLNNRRGTIGLSVSQVSKAAVGGETINMTHFAEDFGKAANCHAAFALCRDEVERACGNARIIPVAQRDGVAQHTNSACFVEIDESLQLVTESTKESWAEIYEKTAQVVKPAPTKKPYKKRKDE